MYFITAMSNILNTKDRFDSEEYKNHSARCFGYYVKKEDAIEAVKMNNSDMWETIYNFVIIEKIEEGIHGFAEVIGWFEYNIEKDEYEPIEVGRTGFSNYAIG